MKRSSAIAAAITLWCVVGPAQAEPAGQAEPAVQAPVGLELHGELPFTHAELDSALSARLVDPLLDLRALGQDPVIRVIALENEVIVRIDKHEGRERRVALGERRGTSAARAVALVIMDLLFPNGPSLPMPPELLSTVPSAALALPEQTPEPPPAPQPQPASEAQAQRTDALASTLPAPGPAMPATGHAAQAPTTHAPSQLQPGPDTVLPPVLSAAPGQGPSGQPLQPETSAQQPAPPRPFRLHAGLSAGGILGPEDTDTALRSVAGELGAGLGPWQVSAAAGWWSLSSRLGQARSELSLDALALRLSAGVKLRDLELLPSLFVAPYRVSDAVEASGQLFGTGVAVRLTVPLFGRLALIGSAGGDYFIKRIEVETPTRVLMTTPRVGLSLSAGLAWQLKP